MVFNAFELMGASRYLRARREEGFVSVIAVFSFLGIMLGVAVLIIVMAVMNGFRQELLSRILGVNGHLTVFADGPAMMNFDDLVARLESVDGVVSVTPQVQGQVMITTQGAATGGLVHGLRPEDIAARPILADNIVAGSLADYGVDDGLLIGARLAQQLGVGVGGNVTLVSPSGHHTVMGTIPRMKPYRLAGPFAVGLSEYETGFTASEE